MSVSGSQAATSFGGDHATKNTPKGFISICGYKPANPKKMNAFAGGGRRQYSFFVRVEYTGRVKALHRSELCQDHGQRPASGPVTVQSEGVNESPSGEDLAQAADKLEPVSDKYGKP